MSFLPFRYFILIAYWVLRGAHNIVRRNANRWLRGHSGLIRAHHWLEGGPPIPTPLTKGIFKCHSIFEK